MSNCNVVLPSIANADFAKHTFTEEAISVLEIYTYNIGPVRSNLTPNINPRFMSGMVAFGCPLVIGVQNGESIPGCE